MGYDVIASSSGKSLDQTKWHRDMKIYSQNPNKGIAWLHQAGLDYPNQANGQTHFFRITPWAHKQKASGLLLPTTASSETLRQGETAPRACTKPMATHQTTTIDTCDLARGRAHQLPCLPFSWPCFSRLNVALIRSCNTGSGGKGWI